MNKILIIDLHCDALLPSGLGEFGGGNTYSKAVISAIINSGIECLYITRKKLSNLLDEEKIAPNLTYIRIKIAPDEIEDKDILFKYSDEIFETILKIMKKMNFIPELIHSIYWPSGIVAQKLCKQFKIPYIHTILSNGKRKLLQSGNYEIADIRIRHEEDCFQNAKYIICSSRYELEDINKLYDIPYEKLILTGLEVENSFKNPSYNRSGNYKINSVNPQDTHYISIDKSSHTNPSLWWNKGAFLYYGRLHPDKGIIEIINSWLELKAKHPNLPVLWIAGGSPEQIHKIRKLVVDQVNLDYYEKSQAIIWWGRLSAEGLSTLLLKTLVLVTHSRYESGGLMILESLAHGVPVIATPYGYANDYVRNWENGFIVPYNDCDLLKKRMLHFMYQPFLSSIMGHHANLQYKKISKEFDFENKHINLYLGKNTSCKTDVNNINICETGLSYPLTEYLPTDEEVLSFFGQFIRNNTWDIGAIPILLKSEDYNKYHIWIIEYNTQKYQCFRWKSHLNMNKIFVEKHKYFYTSEELTETDKFLYNVKICPSPINMPMEYKISIFPLTHKNNSHFSIKENFDILFKSLSIVQTTLDYMNFHERVFEAEEMLLNYSFHVEDISSIIYHTLVHVNLDEEELGLIPKFLTAHSFIDNQLTHLGQLCIGPQSCFYALYLLENNIIEADYFQRFFHENNIQKQIHRNIIYWLLNHLFYRTSQDLIYNNNLDKGSINQMEKLLHLLKQYN